ncbi:MAG: hypothetical protein ABIG29_00430 [Candidatus Nealsonbacteria bacterium]
MSKANKIKIIVFSLLLFSGILFNAQSARAFFDVPFAIMGTQLDALDFIDNSLLRYMTLLAFLLVQGVVLLLFSANLLEWAAAYPIGLGPDNLLVNRGWEITSNLTNMFFILIFLAIAISYILKLETFGMKKALPRLIIVALLTNFSLLFTRMIVDIGWVTQNSFFNIFFGGNQGFATTALQPLTKNISTIIGFLTADLAWFVGFALVPGLNVAKTAFLALWFFTMGGWGLVSEAVIFTVFSLSAGFIFLAYALFFLFRIAVIWILAILAPLAFAAYILPSTEKFFKQWLHTLIQWLLFGIVTFFLMGLGLSLFGVISGKSVAIDFTGTQPWSVPGELSKFLFLLVYLVTTFAVARKTAPIGTDMLWNLSSMATKKFGQWSGRKVMAPGMSWLRDRVGTTAREHIPESVKKWGERQAMAPGAWGFARRSLGVALGPAIINAGKQKIVEIEKSIKETEGVPELLKRYRSALDESTRIAVLNTLIKRQKVNDVIDPVKLMEKYGFSKTDAAKASLSLKDVGKDYERAKRSGSEDTIKAGFMNLPEVKAFERLKKPGIKDADIYKDIILKMKKVDDWKNITKTVLDDKDCMEAIFKNATGNQLSQILEVHQKDGADAVRNNIKKLAASAKMSELDWIKKNTRLEQYFKTPGAQNYGFTFK